METAAAAIDTLIDKELSELDASGAADDVVAKKRAWLAAWRQDTLAALWVKLERVGAFRDDARDPDPEGVT